MYHKKVSLTATAGFAASFTKFLEPIAFFKEKYLNPIKFLFGENSAFGYSLSKILATLGDDEKWVLEEINSEVRNVRIWTMFRLFGEDFNAVSWKYLKIILDDEGSDIFFFPFGFISRVDGYRFRFTKSQTRSTIDCLV